MTSLRARLDDALLMAGWLLIPISLLFFCIPFFLPVNDNGFGVFMLNYSLSLTYTGYLLWNRRRRVEEHRVHYRSSQLILFLISAFALNREITVFATSPFWLCCVLVGVCANYLVAALYDSLPRWAQVLNTFIMGVAFVLFAYYAVYVLPLYIISVVGLIALGISIHTFIPLLLCINSVRHVMRQASGRNGYWMAFTGGVISCVMVIVTYTVMWSMEVKELNRGYLAALTSEAELPGWVQVAQRTGNNPLAEKVLKTDLIYKTADWENNLLLTMPEVARGEEQKVHDPLVMISVLFSGHLLAPVEDRARILKDRYKARHQALDRLWSGDHLSTENVNTRVRVWPEMHLAYTEKIITVFNHAAQKWSAPEEAIYTLHMPEGAVVTSLSLWILGKEEKAILTSKGKATNAYSTIVGREMRDPSVVHWQEGNTVSIRVFPVAPGESRTFKIGITAPLKKDGERLVYDNAWFYGPDASGAGESVTVELMNAPESFVRHAVFTPDRNSNSNNKSFTRTGKYRARWNLEFKEQGLRPHVFSFDGSEYYLKPYNPKRAPVQLNDIYLDLNSAWTEKDLEQVWEAAKGKNIWAYDNEMVRVSEDNRKDLFQKLSQRRFSLFPFHHVKDVQHSLVVSRSETHSPNLSELEGTVFLNRLKAFAAKGSKVKFFHLGGELSSYLRSVKEFRLLEFEQGDAALLRGLLRKGEFVQDTENDSEVIVHSAEIAIAKVPGGRASTAPDHLMRLFAYNHIMQQVGGNGLVGKEGEEDGTLVEEAHKAYVVSPVSSLVVLETQKDYDRFDIKDKGNSLKNASFSANGAVPEPHEWAMIVLLLVVVLFVYVKVKI